MNIHEAAVKRFRVVALRQDLVDDGRVDRAGVDRIAANAIAFLRKVQCAGFGHQGDCGLGGIVGAQVGRCFHPRKRGHVDDRAAMRLHLRQGSLNAHEHAQHIDVQLVPELRQRQVFDRTERGDPGIVDQHIDPRDRGNRRSPRFLARHIQFHEPGADVRSQRIAARHIDIGHDHAGPFGGIGAGNRLAQSRCPAGDERGLSCKHGHGFALPVQIRTSVLPVVRPLIRSMKASGSFSSPSRRFSSGLSLPSANRRSSMACASPSTSG